MISRISLGFQEILIWSGNYKGICQVGTRVISENFLEFLERPTPRNRSNRYHLPPEMEVPKKSKIGTDFLIFTESGNYWSKINFSRGGFSKTKSIFPNRSKRYACRSVTCGGDFPVPAWVPRGRCPYKNWNEMEVPEKLQKVEVEFLPFRTRVPKSVCKFTVRHFFGVPDH